MKKVDKLMFRDCTKDIRKQIIASYHIQRQAIATVDQNDDKKKGKK